MRWPARSAAWEALPLWARQLHGVARRNAAARGIPFQLSDEDYAAIVLAAGDCCAVSGMRFQHEKHAIAKRRPFAPSIDRIDASRGYELGNVRLVCAAVNLAMNEWGEDVLIRIAGAIAAKRGGSAYIKAAGYKHLPGIDSYVTRRFGVRYRARATVNGKKVRLPGSFSSEIDARERLVAFELGHELAGDSSSKR